jgi:hypothetical protein
LSVLARRNFLQSLGSDLGLSEFSHETCGAKNLITASLPNFVVDFMVSFMVV